MILALGVALAGGVGAGLRWLSDALLSRHRRGDFPWPILLVNLTGCFALATLTIVGGALAGPALTVLTGGLLGGFTTYSTVSVDSAELWRNGRMWLGTVNAVGTLAACAAASAAGILFGQLLV